MEGEANEFASALLMPKNDVTIALSGKLDLRRLAALKPEWRVSMQALLYRAQSLGLIGKQQAGWLWRQFNMNRIKLREPPELDFPQEQPGVITRMVRLHLDTFGYLAGEFAKLLHIHERDERIDARVLGVELVAGGPLEWRDHGFVMPVFPPSTRKEYRQVSLRIVGTPDMLVGGLIVASPKVTIDGSKYRGCCEPDDEGVLHGWVWRPGSPEERIEVALFVDDRFLALARPIEGARTGFDDHCARIDLCEGCEKLITHHPALQDDVAAAIDAMTVASLILGGRDWNAGCGNDRQDTPGVFRFDVTASPLER